MNIYGYKETVGDSLMPPWFGALYDLLSCSREPVTDLFKLFFLSKYRTCQIVEKSYVLTSKPRNWSWKKREARTTGRA
jgi:hypothetical protein